MTNIKDIVVSVEPNFDSSDDNHTTFLAFPSISFIEICEFNSLLSTKQD